MKPIDRARRYVAKMPPAISGQRGHDRTFHVACVLLHGFALRPDEAMHVLEDFSARCDPPWSEAELTHKLEDAAKTPPREPIGYLLHAPRIPFMEELLRPADSPATKTRTIYWLSSPTNSDAMDATRKLSRV